MTANAATRLLQHYVDNFRRLPWRAEPGAAAPDPYRVWLSEIMLQQTTVAAVVPRFERFVARWPTVEALAAADDAEILSEWAGLGYYARARNLIACAREIVQRGGFPTTVTELQQLPGVGAYTAAAIAAIAFGEDAYPVDTNIARVVARLRAIPRPERREIEAVLRQTVPSGQAGDFAQALMDLGATICRPKAPACERCPLNRECAAFLRGTPESFPARKAKRTRPLRHGIAYWIEQAGHVWLVRRPDEGLLGGMAALPGTQWTERAPGLPGPPIGSVRHVFTHLVLELQVVRGSEPVGEGWWQSLDALDSAGLPTLYRRAAEISVREQQPSARAAA